MIAEDESLSRNGRLTGELVDIVGLGVDCRYVICIAPEKVVVINRRVTNMLKPMIFFFIVISSIEIIYQVFIIVRIPFYNEHEC
jgi:hypothetical protein